MDEIEFDDHEVMDDITAALAESDAPVVATVYVDGKAEGYWGVTEYGGKPGNKPWPKPGPRTQRGVGNRSGRIMSRQAPAGWVQKNLDKCWKFLSDALVRRIHDKHRGLTRAETKEAVTEAAKRARNLFIDSAPKDTGALRDSIKLTVDD